MRDISDNEYDQHVRNMNAYGYTVAKEFIDSGTLKRLQETTYRCYESVKDLDYQGRPARDVKDLRIYNLQNKDFIYIEILGVPFVRKIMMEMLNDPYYRWLPEDVPNYILQNFNARSSGNALELHIDSRIPIAGKQAISCQVIYLLEDMNQENGCSVVAPGTHRSGSYSDRELENIPQLNAKAGDLIVWDSRLWHGTLANSSDRSRWALIATFCMWWMKQDVNMVKSLPNEFYTRMSDEQKQLIGYCSIPPESEFERINLKCGYDYLKPTVADYFK